MEFICTRQLFCAFFVCLFVCSVETFFLLSFNFATERQRKKMSSAVLAKLQQTATLLQTFAGSNEKKKKEPEDFRRQLESIPLYLLTKSVIRAALPQHSVTYFAIDELEVYCNESSVHQDLFTHGCQDQMSVGNWYFHQQGKTYKNGSYKGLDITCGWERTPIGFLIRTIHRLSTFRVETNCNIEVQEDEKATKSQKQKRGREDEESVPIFQVFEGPSLTVDAILAATGCSAISDLAGPSGGPPIRLDHLRLSLIDVDTATNEMKKSYNNNGPAVIVAIDALQKRAMIETSSSTLPTPGGILRAPRVGLVPRSQEHLSFVARPYRFIIHPNEKVKIAKMRAGIVAAMVATYPTIDSAALVSITGAMKKSVEEIRTKVQKAASDCTLESLNLFNSDVTKTEVIAAIVGYCYAHDHY